MTDLVFFVFLASRGRRFPRSLDPLDPLSLESLGFFFSPRTARVSPTHTPPQVESIDGEVFRPRERIKSQADFNRVGMRGFNWNGKLVRVQWLRNAHVKDVACTRIGIKTPKKQIKLAVHRNLVKRRVRDIFRKNKAEWPETCDFVVYCGAAAKEAEYAALKSEMLYWAREVAPGFEKQNAGPQQQGHGGKKQGGKKRAAQPGSKTDRPSE
jgi:ribonuclease P protein component